MIQDYFIYNDKKYYSGTIIKFTNNEMYSKEKEMIFLGYEPNRHTYILSHGSGGEIGYPESHFYKFFIGVTDKVDDRYRNWVQDRPYNKPKPKTFKDELNIDGLLIAWMWYIFIMAVATIFNDRIGIWILASIIFFNYRNKKLRKVGYK